MNKIKIMVVDDSIMFRTWLVTNLSKESNFEVVGFAVNAMDAMKKLPLYKPDVMTLDIEMPGMTGLEFLQQMLPTPLILCASRTMKTISARMRFSLLWLRRLRLLPMPVSICPRRKALPSPMAPSPESSRRELPLALRQEPQPGGCRFLLLRLTLRPVYPLIRETRLPVFSPPQDIVLLTIWS